MTQAPDDVALPPPGSPGDQSSGLADVARRFRAGGATREELSQAFVKGVLFCPVGDSGVVRIGPEGQGFVPMYSSEVALARGQGACEWFTGQGSDLLSIVAPGDGIVVDRGSDSEVALPAWAVLRNDGAGALDNDRSPDEGAPTR